MREIGHIDVHPGESRGPSPAAEWAPAFAGVHKRPVPIVF